jgi:MFS family permease
MWLPPKPGVIPLRPLGVGEILDGAISTIRAKPRLMIGLSAVVAVLTQLVTVPITWVLLHDTADTAFTLGQTENNPEGDTAFTASSAVASVTQGLVTLVATLLLTGMLTVVLSRAVLGQDIDARQAWDLARPRLLSLIGVTILVFLVEVGVAGILLGPGIALAVSGAPGAAIALAFLVGIPLLLFALPYLYVSFALAPAAVMLEKQHVVASLTRSRRLVKGAWWRTFGILVLVNIIASIVGGIFSAVFTLAAGLYAALMSGGSDFNPYTLVPLIIIGVGSIIGSAITWPFTAVASALIYVDRRIRREGLDLELARAAGYTSVGQSAPGTPLDSNVYGGSPPPAAPYPPPYDG